MDKKTVWQFILIILSIVIPLGVILAIYVFISNRGNRKNTKKWIDLGCIISFMYTFVQILFISIGLFNFI